MGEPYIAKEGIDGEVLLKESYLFGLSRREHLVIQGPNNEVSNEVLQTHVTQIPH